MSLAILGCGSKDDGPAPSNGDSVRFVTNHTTLSISIGGKAPYLPNPVECQEIILHTDNALITYVSSVMGIENKTDYDMLCPRGMMKSVYVTPNAGYRFDGWYCNGAPLVDMTVPFMSDAVTVNAVMVPVSVQ